MADKKKRSRKRVSMTDVAEALGVSVMTVSLALRDDPRIAASTAEKVKTTAKEMGYIRDPELSRLMAYIREVRQFKLQANLAYVHFFEEGKFARQGSYCWDIFQAASKHAERMGYSLQKLPLNMKGLTLKRVVQIIETANIQGFLISPKLAGHDMRLIQRLPHAEFPGVSFSYSLDKPKYNRVATNHYQCMGMAMDTLWEAGFRRIGLILRKEESHNVRGLWTAGFVSWQYQHCRELRIPPLIIHVEEEATLFEWMRQYAPDVVMIQSERLHEYLLNRGYSIPGDLSVAYLNARYANTGHKEGGIVQDVETQGRIAVEQLVAQILARSKGEPAQNTTTLVKGSWHWGPSIPCPGELAHARGSLS